MRSLNLSEPIDRRDLLKLGAAVPFFALNIDGTILAMNGETRERMAPVIHWVFDGGISQAESWDPKPAAQTGFRGDLRAIDTSVPGVQFSETFPQMAEQMNKMTLIRTLRSPSNLHDTATQGFLLNSQRRNFHSARTSSSGSSPFGYFEVSFPGHSFFLRQQFLHQVLPSNTPAHQGSSRIAFTWNGKDFLLPDLPAVDSERLRQRHSLLSTIDRPGFSSPSVETAQENTRLAFDVLLRGLDQRDFDPRLQALFDMRLPPHRAAYLALEFAKRGIPSSTIRGGNWDYHYRISEYMRNNSQQFDSAIAAQITAVERGLAPRNTVIAGSGEFGRTPHINFSGGRDHWAEVHSGFFYGGRFPRGRVVGETDNRWAPRSPAILTQDIQLLIREAAGDPLDARERARLPEGVLS